MIGAIGGALPITIAVLLTAATTGTLGLRWYDVTFRLPWLSVVVAAMATTRTPQSPWTRAARYVLTLAVAYSLVWPWAELAWSGVWGRGVATVLAAAGFSAAMITAQRGPVLFPRLTLALAGLFATGTGAWIAFATSVTIGAPIAGAGTAGMLVALCPVRTATTAGLRALLMVFSVYGLAAGIYGGIPMSHLAALLLLPFIGVRSGTLWPAFYQRRFGLVAATTLVGILAGCGPFKPMTKRDEPPAKSGRVIMTLGGEAHLALTRAGGPWRLRVRVFAVEDGKTGPQEGNDNYFDVSADGAESFVLDNVRLGYKEFGVSVLDTSGKSWGDGQGRHLVVPGTQSLVTPIEITLRPPPLQYRDVGLDIHVRFAVPGTPVVTTWLDVKPLVDATCLAGCHTSIGGAKPASGLDLSVYPFTSDVPDTTQESIVKKSIEALLDPQDLYRMPKPPAPRLGADQIALFRSWLDGGLVQFPAENQTADLAQKIQVSRKMHDGDDSGTLTLTRADDPEHPFRGECKKMIVGARYDLTLQVIGVDGTIVFTHQIADLVVDDSTNLSPIINVEGANPNVTVPVVIHGP